MSFRTMLGSWFFLNIWASSAQPIPTEKDAPTEPLASDASGDRGSQILLRLNNTKGPTRNYHTEIVRLADNLSSHFSRDMLSSRLLMADGQEKEQVTDQLYQGIQELDPVNKAISLLALFKTDVLFYSDENSQSDLHKNRKTNSQSAQ